MTAIKHGQSWHRANNSIKSLIAQCQASGISHLPALRELAMRFGVSRVTLRSALGELVAAGVVSVNGRVGVFLNPPEDSSASGPMADDDDDPQHTPSITSSIKDTLARDILAGRFRIDHPLPSFKELCLRYHASYPTIRKGLEALSGAGMIHRHGRGYRITRPQPRSTRDTIVLIARSDDWAGLCSYTPRSAEFWRVLEQECLRANIALDVRDYDTGVRALRGQDGKKNKPGRVLGYMVWVLGLTGENLRELGILLARQEEPAAFLDEIGDVPVPMVIERNPAIRYFSLANSPRCAEAMGKYLLRNGHRRIAFFSPLPGGRWNDNRSIGLATTYRMAGIADAVTVFSPGRPRNVGQVERQVENDPPFLHLVAHRERFGGYYGPRSPTREETFYRILGVHMLSVEYWCGVLEPHFKQALDDPSITAWVGINDVIAILALDFLRRNNVAVPGRISVCGFDDTLDALGQGLTSYNFNVPVVVTGMLDFVLRRGVERGEGDGRVRETGRRDFPVEVEGMVMERGSSGGMVVRSMP